MCRTCSCWLCVLCADRRVPITGTFKHQKVQLRKEGCDPTVVPDPMFWLNPDRKTYEPLDAKAYHALATVSKL